MVTYKSYSLEEQRYFKILYNFFAERFGKLRVLNLTVGRGFTLRFYPETTEYVEGIDIEPHVEELPKHLEGKVVIRKIDYFKYIDSLDSTEKFNVVEIDPLSSRDSILLLKKFLNKRNSPCGFHVSFFDTFIKRNLRFRGSILDFADEIGIMDLPKELLSSIPFIIAYIVENLGWRFELFVYRNGRNTWHVGGVVTREGARKIGVDMSKYFIPKSSVPKSKKHELKNTWW